MNGILEIRLSNFRNHSLLELSKLSPSLNLVVGPNGSGKTSILESISILSPGKGIRGAKSSEILSDFSQFKGNNVQLDAASGGFADVSCETWAAFFKISDSEIVISHNSSGGRDSKTIKEDTNVLKSSKALLNISRVVWFTPQMSYLFLQGAEDRRKFLDRIVYNHVPQHSSNMIQYKKLVRSRMKVLKESGISMHSTWLETLEWQIAELANKIVTERNKVIHKVSGVLQDKFNWDWYPIFDLQTKHFYGVDEEFCASKYSKLLADNRNRDLIVGRTSIGPHNDDILVKHSKKKIEGKLCSTGEQKGCVLKIILAHLECLRAQLEPKIPIMLLLDDVFAHIDDANKALIMDAIGNTTGVQKWISGTQNDINFLESCDLQRSEGAVEKITL